MLNSLFDFNNLSVGFSYNLEIRKLLLLLLTAGASATTASPRNWSPMECGVMPLETFAFQWKPSPPFYFPGPMYMHLIGRRYSQPCPGSKGTVIFQVSDPTKQKKGYDVA